MRRRSLLQASAAAAILPRVSFAATGMPRDQAAAHALNRLGFGPRPGELATVARDPQAWIDQQLQPASLALPPLLTARLDESRFTDPDPLPAVRELVQRIRANQKAAGDVDQPENPVRVFVRSQQLPAIESRLFRALESPRQLEEAMVDFWFNHFNVFQGKNWVRVLVGHYEHSAIRPHALGRFRDLLGATAQHPAMLYYLDNWLSVGPQQARRGRGLNENYARELMELHTLGVDGGYTQQDVTQLARMLTGWTFAPNGNAAATGPYGFLFAPRLHDDGEKTWLGQRIASAGKAEGDFALDLLARHPATARHVSSKLAQYFVADEPDPRLVERMARVFLAEDGRILPVLRTLFASDAFWNVSIFGAKFKTPYQYCLSALRAGGWQLRTGLPLAGHLASQGMPLYGCQTPDGYKNTEGAWLAADGVNKRIEFASQLASGRLGPERLAAAPPPEDLMEQLGPLVTPATRTLVSEREGQRNVAVAMVLAGPGMMRR